MEGLTQLLSRTGDGVCAVDEQQTIVFWNDSAQRILGYTSDEALGRRCYEVICGRDADGCPICRKDCRTSTRARRGELVETGSVHTHTKNGAPIRIEVSTLVMPQSMRDFGLLAHLFHDCKGELELESMLKHWLNESAGEEETASSTLTPRERQVLFHLAAGSSTEQIAGELFICTTTVRNHIRSILGKLGVHSRAQAVSFAVRNSLL